MTNFVKSFTWAWNGIRTVWREEVNFRIETSIAILMVVLGAYFHFLVLEWMIIIACIGAVLGAEILNTAVEDLCNKVEPNTDPAIGKIKDMMGGLVLVVSMAAGVIGLLVLSDYLPYLF